MGNKNARAKRSFDLPNLTLPSLVTADGNAATDVSATTSPKTPLGFKSFRQGTLITPNFEALGKGVAAKSLSATSPVFVPALLNKIPPFLKAPVDNRSGASPVKELENQSEMADCTQSNGTPCHVHSVDDDLTAVFKLPMKLDHGATPANRNDSNAKHGLEPDQKAGINLLQDGMNAMSIHSAKSTPDKSGSSSFATPTKKNETPLSTPSPTVLPTGPRPEKPRFGRADKKKKDIIITHLGVIRNFARITERYTENGYPYKYACADEFQPDVYKVADIIIKMPAKDRGEFWEKNWIEIEVDFRSEGEITGTNAQVAGQEESPKDYDTLLHHIDCLGPEFAAHAKYIFVNILFPSIADTNQSKANSSVQTCQETREFQHIERLVAKLQLFPNIKRLDIILQTPSNTKKPLSIAQLNLVLPFYDLGFTNWNIKWRTSFMTKAEAVGGWPIHYLDKERNRLLRERERVKNAVFVRKSQFVT
ncbi:uncharacterized protein EAE97_007837 [Botrytis byssoidea]|uniref:Uncharacterized protein n=1 Tax=Botrytis byssoidea TaxID=139641 RepID=A0A9P5LR86_9HELO|nr:uncharacterized protein EAE97_007837 [Botrytis byssoidea]KAF7936471.1 hypothetical protein EAE97_007837 [Botrytis byssoidea]